MNCIRNQITNLWGLDRPHSGRKSQDQYRCSSLLQSCVGGRSKPKLQRGSSVQGQQVEWGDDRTTHPKPHRHHLWFYLGKVRIQNRDRLWRNRNGYSYGQVPSIHRENEGRKVLVWELPTVSEQHGQGRLNTIDQAQLCFGSSTFPSISTAESCSDRMYILGDSTSPPCKGPAGPSS